MWNSENCTDMFYGAGKPHNGEGVLNKTTPNVFTVT